MIISPRSFDENSVLLIEPPDVYMRYTEGDVVTLRETVVEYEDEDDVLRMSDGLCLVALADDFYSLPQFLTSGSDEHSLPEAADYLRHILNRLSFAQCRNGRVRRSDNLDIGIRLRTAGTESEIEVHLMRNLAEFMCDFESGLRTSTWNFIQTPGAYMTLWRSGSFVGCLNRDVHRLGPVDLVWIEHDLCLFWMRSYDSLPNFCWIKLLPFRIDRTGDPGPLLKKYKVGWRGLRMQWYRRPASH